MPPRALTEMGEMMSMTAADCRTTRDRVQIAQPRRQVLQRQSIGSLIDP